MSKVKPISKYALVMIDIASYGKTKYNTNQYNVVISGNSIFL
jgi:hypothetical protein